MELSQLNTFKVVAKTLHFTRASEQLNLTQPAVSHQIKSLERETGEKLFVRGRNRSISLTIHGERILEYANQLLAEVEDMKRAISDSNPDHEGVINATTSLPLVTSPFVTIREAFRKKYPNVEVFLKASANHDDLADRLRSGEFNFGVTDSRSNSGGLIAIPYGNSELVPVVGRDHKFAGTKRLALSDLMDEEWILFPKGSSHRKVIDAMFVRNGLRPARVYDPNDESVIRELIKLGNGIGFLPGWSIKADIESGVLFPIDFGTDVRVPLYILVSKQNLTPVVCSHVDFVLEMQISGVELDDSANWRE